MKTTPHLIFLLFLVAGARPAAAGPGDLDPSFGTGGATLTPLSTSLFGHARLALQPDGKILVAVDEETNNADLAVARFQPDGTLDASFGSGGIVTTPTSAGDEAAVAIAVQPDGKILAAAADPEIRIVRYDASGALDPTWGTDGIVATGLQGGTFDGLGDLLLLPDGDVLVGGSFAGAFALSRLTADGDLDGSFGTGGFVITALGGSASLTRLVRQADGKVVATGSSGGTISTVRYFATGVPDPGFGSNGVVSSAAGGIARDVVVQPDGRILVLGQEGRTVGLEPTLWLLLRYSSGGVPDPTWGDEGVVARSIPGPSATSNVRAFVLQGDGRVVAIGDSIPDPFVAFDVDLATARFATDGSLDASWGGTGIVLDDFGALVELGTDVARQSDGKLVVAGTNGAALLLLRYLPGEFCGDGNVQAGETCDDGNVLEGDCCSPACTLEPAGTSCTDDGAACTADACDAAGTCAHEPLPEGAACEDGSPCTTGETCTAGICGGGTAGGAGCLNPFVCYKTKATRGAPRFGGVSGLFLADELESGSFDVRNQFELCVPAHVNDQEIQNPEVRQVAYKLRASSGEPRHAPRVGLVVEDHFGTHRFDTKKVELLLAPAHLSRVEPPLPPAPDVADAYKCYKVRTSKGLPLFPQTQAAATDELEDRIYDVFAPRRLCFPVDEDGSEPVDPEGLLTCYRVRRAGLQPPHAKVQGEIHTADAFGALRLDTNKERDLCVPARLVP